MGDEMKSENKRLEDLETIQTPAKEWHIVYQDLDNRERYFEKNKETGEKEYMTLEEAKKLYEDLIIVSYSDKWKSERQLDIGEL